MSDFEQFRRPAYRENGKDGQDRHPWHLGRLQRPACGLREAVLRVAYSESVKDWSALSHTTRGMGIASAVSRWQKGLDGATREQWAELKRLVS